MLIHNISNSPENKRKGVSPTNLVVQCLKNKPEDPDFVIPVGNIIDTAMYVNFDDNRVKNNPDLVKWEREGLLKFLDKYPEAPSAEKLEQMKKDNDKEVKKYQILDIKSSDNLSELQDIVDNSNDINLVRSAMVRLQELEGDIQENPELRETTNSLV